MSEYVHPDTCVNGIKRKNRDGESLGLEAGPLATIYVKCIWVGRWEFEGVRLEQDLYETRSNINSSNMRRLVVSDLR